MAKVNGIIFDADVKRLVQLLLKECAKKHAGYMRYDSVDDQLVFEVANRGLVLLGFGPIAAEPRPEPKK